MEHEESISGLESKAAEIRRLLLGALLLSKDTWENEFVQTGEGRQLLERLEEEERMFVDSSIADPIERLDDTLDLILRRANSLFRLVEYLSRELHPGPG